MILFANTHNDIGLTPMILLAKARNDMILNRRFCASKNIIQLVEYHCGSNITEPLGSISL